MKIAIGCDHGGFVLKQACVDKIKELGYEIIDFGTNNAESVDYPDYAEKVAKAVAEGKCDKGVLLCGTGIGISIAANKFKGVYCAHVTDEFCAEKAAEHNNANIIAMGGRITAPEKAASFLEIFLKTSFGEGRHATRVNKIKRFEDENFK